MSEHHGDGGNEAPTRRAALALALRTLWDDAGRPTHDRVAARINAQRAIGRRQVRDKRIGEWLRGVQVPSDFDALWR